MSTPPHSMEATSAAEAAAVARRRKSQPNGWWGMACFIATEGAFFGTLVASYFYLSFNNKAWPPPGIEAPSVALPIILTGVLVLTSVPMWMASRAATAGRRGAAMAAAGFAMLVQGGYLAVQIILYLKDLEKFGPGDHAYGSIYFTMLGAHHAHVAIGIALNAWVLFRLSRGLTNYRVITVRVVTFYWYFVNVVAVFIVATQVSPG